MEILILILMLLTMVCYVNYAIIKNELSIDKNKFNNKWSNRLYLLSYAFPFNILLKDSTEIRKKNKNIEDKIYTLNLDKMFNLRSFLTLRFLILIISLVVLTSLGILNSNLSIFKNPFLLIPFLLVSLTPNIYLKFVDKKYQKFYYDEVVILQLFIVSMVQNNSTVEAILYSLAKMNTFHKKTFENAYRISLRNKKEALEFLEVKFETISFGNTFNALNNITEYSRESSVRILESNLKQIEKDSINNKRKDELGKSSLAQVSMIVPFLISILLGAMPLIFYGINSIIEIMVDL